MKAACTDAEFIELWRTIGKGAEIASKLGTSERSVMQRRRRLEQKHGVKLDSRGPQAKHYRHLQTAHQRDGNIFLGIENGTVIAFSDAHFWPGIRTTAYDGLLHLIRELQPKAVVCNGDAFDGAQISRHPRIQWDEKPSVVAELKACEIALGEIEDTAKKARSNVRLIWPAGNHDLRLEARLAANAPEFQGVNGFTLKDHFPAWEPCWAVWPTEEVIVKHRYRSGVHATHQNTVNSGKSIVTGHLHSLKVSAWTDYSGTRFGVDCGTLAEPNGPQFLDYLEAGPTNWRSGFVVLTFVNGRMLWPEVVPVFGPGQIEFRGKVIDVGAGA